MNRLTPLLLLASLAAAPRAHADELNLSALDELKTPDRVELTTGAEYAFVVGVRYSHILPFLDRQIALSADAAVPWASFDLGDYRVRASALVPIVGTRSWKVAGALAPSLRGSQNLIATLTGVGVDASLLAGFYRPRGFLAFEAGVDLEVATHIAPTSDYRNQVDAMAQSHWYAAPGANLRAGLQGGLSFGRYDAIVRAGEVRDASGAAPLLPFYATLGVATRW